MPPHGGTPQQRQGTQWCSGNPGLRGQKFTNDDGRDIPGRCDCPLEIGNQRLRIEDRGNFVRQRINGHYLRTLKDVVKA